uniref:START domain-containing protein n=1 Tax=Steinernema glaseri TaxID=37863 RepID=A0A1I7XZX8_9BILA
MNIVWSAIRRLNLERTARDQYSFELLKSTSAQEFGSESPTRSGGGRRGRRHNLPRFYSQHEGMARAADSRRTASEEVIEVFNEETTQMASDQSVLLGFIHNSSENYDADQQCASFNFQTDDVSLDKAISECHAIRGHPQCSEGVLLKCLDPNPMFPFLHYAIFKDGSEEERIDEITTVVRHLNVRPKSYYGAYDEVSWILKSASNVPTGLPAHRHSGYIVISFKLLDDQCKQENLEKSWLSWSGAREVYKYSPRNWNLRKITLHRYPFATNGGPRPFVYVLMCEFGNILHPSNTIQALDMCQRLRVRNCGHIALYQIQYNYSNLAPLQPSPVTPRKTSTHQLHPTPTLSPSRRVISGQKRNPMVRGFSQEVESSDAALRRNHKLRLDRSRERLSPFDEAQRFNSYHHFDEFA